MAKKKENYKNKEWLELCDYIKKEILNYDDNMKFPSYLALKLQGLKKGQHIANNNCETNACYDDYTLLCTFKICRNKIVDYMIKNETKIKDEKHKINLIIKIVEPEMNDVYIRLQQAKKKEEKIKDNNFDNQYNDGAEYKSISKEVNEKLKKLW